jgi:hypothetical protein
MQEQLHPMLRYNDLYTEMAVELQVNSAMTLQYAINNSLKQWQCLPLPELPPDDLPSSILESEGGVGSELLTDNPAKSKI